MVMSRDLAENVTAALPAQAERLLAIELPERDRVPS